MIRLALLATLAGGPAIAAPDQSCVDVKIGDERFYDCLNRDLSAYTTAPKSSASDAPGLNRSGPALGVFNQAAERERLGNAFGTSLTPQRAPRVFAPPPLGH